MFEFSLSNLMPPSPRAGFKYRFLILIRDFNKKETQKRLQSKYLISFVKLKKKYTDDVCEVNEENSSLWPSRSEDEDIQQILKNVALTVPLGKICSAWLLNSKGCSERKTNVFKAGSSKVDSACHPFEVDEMSTRNIWELSGKK